MFSLQCCGAFLRLWQVGATLQLPCAGFSLQWLLLLQSMSSRVLGSVLVAPGLSSCGTWALECKLNGCGAQAWLLCGMWDLPRSGIEPMSPALTGRFVTSEPLGKTYSLIKTLRPIDLYLIVVPLNPILSLLPSLSPP